jgi:hypothetical protein
MNIFDLTKSYGDSIKNGRTPLQIYNHSTTEINELVEEISNHVRGLPAGEDGIIGESIDVILCMIDLIQTYDSSFTNEDFMKYCEKKLNKWRDKNVN